VKSAQALHAIHGQMDAEYTAANELILVLVWLRAHIIIEILSRLFG
jgi:hypothetical protein